MEPSAERLAVLRRIAERVPRAGGADCVQVAIDGGDGAGKTIFADELADVVRATGRAAVRVSVDDFHNPRAVRYRRGRESAVGFWLDSFDYERLEADVLAPLGPGGTREYRAAAHELRSDAELRPPPSTAPPGAALILDGLFLHRDELRSRWDLSVWLDVPFEITAARMAERDGTPADPEDPRMQRYVGAQRIYRAACDPLHRAHVVIDNSDPAHPIVRANR